MIGITCGFQLSSDGESPAGRAYLATDYSDAVLRAGGFACPLPVPCGVKAGTPGDSAAPDFLLIDEILRRMDGLLFTGGPDIDPQRYGETRHEKTHVLHPRREAFELALFRRAD